MPDRIRMKNDNNARFIDIFGIPRQEIKDFEITIALVFDIKVDTNVFTACFLRYKLYNACELLEIRLNKQSMMLLKA